MLDDGIRERHGVRCTIRPVTIQENDDHIALEGCFEERKLTEFQARYLAAKLYRLARRIRQRKEATDAKD